MSLKLSQAVPSLSNWSSQLRRRQATALATLQFIRTHIYTRSLPPPPAPDQPQSHRPYDSRRTLLHRTYVSLLRSSPLLVFFQHNNMIPAEYFALQIQLKRALETVDTTLAANAVPAAATEESSSNEGEEAVTTQVETQRKNIGRYVRMSVLNGKIFATALRAVEYMPPDSKAPMTSREAYMKTIKYKKKHPLTPMLIGPIGVIEFPTLSVPHLEAVMNLLFPEKIVAKKGSDPNFISGLNKMILLGAKIDGVRGSIVDVDKIKWMSTLGGLDTLRAQLVGILQQSAGQNIVQCLESPGRAMWLTMESRRRMLEEPEAATAEPEAGAAEKSS